MYTKKHESIGPGNIRTKILKGFKKYFSKSEILKHAKNIPIFKKRDQQNYSNYRQMGLCPQ